MTPDHILVPKLIHQTIQINLTVCLMNKKIMFWSKLYNPMPSSVQSNLFPQNVAQTWETFSPGVVEVPSPHLTFAGIILFQNGFTDDPEKSHCTKWCNCWIPAVCGEQEKSCRIDPALERSTNPCKSTQVQHLSKLNYASEKSSTLLLYRIRLAPNLTKPTHSSHQSWCGTLFNPDGTNSAGYIVVTQIIWSHVTS